MNITTVRCEQATKALQQSAIPALRRIRVENDGERLVLHGKVHTYYQKQLAQETVLPVLNGGRLENRVLVASRD